ncbi:MAG: extracellular solute-binding protein [Rhizobiales bacterium]|nr:extracellular solute-binding protein [Hyphomicrobiales bacterium]
MRKLALTIAALLAGTTMVQAAGELHIFNWGNYTAPDLIKKFEETYQVKVTVTDYDSNDTALAKIEAGGHGFDIVVPSASYVPIFAGKGLLMELNPAEFKNHGNIAPEWRDVTWDPGRKFTVPWQWGSTGVAVNKSVYAGDPNTSDIFLNPPDELKGKINVVPEMMDVIPLTILYAGGELCTEDKDVLRKVRDLLMAAKPHWMSMDYGMTEKLGNSDVSASVNWSGSTMRARLVNPNVVYGYPNEGYMLWMDSAGILSDAKNVENAKLFLDFIMLPENAAMISAFARYSNGISGSEAYMPEEMKTAPEVVIPAEFKAAGHFNPTCSPAAQALYTAIWTELQK